MNEHLGTERLRDDSVLIIRRVTTPDMEMADSIEPLLGHKREPWNSQNRTILRSDTSPMESYYYVGFIGAELIANVSAYIYRGVGILGHVYTDREHRRKGVSRALMAACLSDFGETGGKALYLSTGYGSTAYRIYHEYGFRSVLPESGDMALYIGADESSYQAERFEKGSATTVRESDWRDWAGFSALTIQGNGSTVRSVLYSLYGRRSMEFEYLRLRSAGTPSSIRGLETDRGVVVGMAFAVPDPRFPGIAHADCFVHPAYHAHSTKLLRSATDIDAPIQAYCPASDEARISAYEDLGFVQNGRLPDLSVGAERINMHRFIRS